MDAKEVLDTLDVINTSFKFINTEPKAREDIKSMLESVAPHVNVAGRDAHASYIAATQRLIYGMEPLVNPRTGAEVIV